MSNKKCLNPVIVDYIKAVIAEVTEINQARLSIDEPLESYGINSTMIFSLNAVLQRKFTALPRTLFFEYKTIEELAEYFAASHAQAFADANASPATGAVQNSGEDLRPSTPAPASPPALQKIRETAAGKAEKPGADWFDQIPLPQFAAANPGTTPVDIAIIGMAGRYPGARNLREFWTLLAEGQDCITEVPSSRWDQAAIFSEDSQAENKVFAKWGGFIADHEGFDHRFFNISPIEAKKMDPQERWFLQTAWNTFEDAGYTRAQISGRKLGVFVGVMWSQYQLHAAERCSLTHLEAASSSFSSIANRVSYTLNLHGPSIALDTMCSSSISAIHMACQSLVCGETEMALAGGVNICSHPAKYIHLCEGKFAATDGRCRTFGDGGSGYVPGEGIGAVLLKPLAKALADGDIIHGVVKATALNHGGKTNGYTVPNPVAQAAVVRDALAKSGVAAEDISVIEAHGTGTSLGDPIEIAGLLSAYGEAFNPQFGCAIGSVKSNIGHLESAAGIAGLSKLLLQMRHRMLVPSLHSRELNKNIDWDNLPFKVQQKREPWRSKLDTPVFAALSAFGAGGSNGHLVLSSYTAPARKKSSSSQLLIISAASKRSLELICRDLARFLRSDSETRLADLAFTLQVGREGFSQRVAFAVDTIEQAITELDQLAQAVADEVEDARIASVQPSVLTELLKGEAGQQFIQQLFATRDWSALAKLWLGGAKIEWLALDRGSHPEETPARISLPGYVFDLRNFGYGAPVWMEQPREPLALPAAETQEVIADTDREFVSINQQVWRTPAAIPEGNSELPERGIIISHRETQALAQQLRSQPGFKNFDIIYPEAGDLAALFNSLQLTRADSFAVIRLWASAIEAEQPSSQDCAGVVDEFLALRPLLRARCALRYLWVNIAGAAGHLPAAKLARGFTTALGGEFKQLTAASLDLDQRDSHCLETILRVWKSFSAAQQYRFLGRRLESLTLEPLPLIHSEIKVDSDKCHLITGGTGGIGLQIAEWLASRGAKHIVLCGRQTLPDRSTWAQLIAAPATDPTMRTRLAGLSRLPASVTTAVLDLASETRVSNFINALGQERDLGYVFHCAGIADEETPLFMDKTVDSIARVFSPKVQGSDHLLAALNKTPCQQLVLVSSLASVSPGLAAGLVDYAVANNYLNSLAEGSRLGAGNKPTVLSVLMPNWREVGLGETRSPHYAKLGLTSVANRQGIALLEQSMLNQSPVILPLVVNQQFALEQLTHVTRAVPPAEPTRVAGADSAAAREPGIATALPDTRAVSATAKPAAAAQWGAAIPDQAVAREDVIAALQIQLAPVLGMSAGEWGANDEFSALGVDSVLLAALATKIEKWLAVHFSADILLTFTSLHRLAEHLLHDHSAAVHNVLGGAQAAGKKPQPDGGQRQSLLPDTKVEERIAPAAPLLPPATAANSALASAPRPDQTAAQANAGHQANRAFATAKKPADEPIAIVGMGAIFPGAGDIHAYWDLLREGRSAIGEVPATRWDIATIFNPAGDAGQSISKWGGFVEGVEYFSPSRFGLPEEIGADADPLLRLAMRAADSALRDAGISAEAISGQNVGVFIGSRVSTYSERIPQYGKNTLLGIAQNFIAAHISHWLNLKGPALVLDSACSSSLLSLHIACQSLREGDCDIALAGGSEYLLDEIPYQTLSQAKALSPTGQCRTFDAEADGFVPGEGAGIVVLKTLSQALIDGDRIYALVNASAVNNDGRTMGVTTPNPDAQQAVIRTALAKAGFSADSLGYLEAHGTGTRLGDPMELKALTQVYREHTGRKGYCAIGSVKSNLGHLLSAAGVASVIKVALSIYHQTLVPTLNCATPNPRFNFAESPFYPCAKAAPWQSADNYCRAGISAFGFGGTNLHVLLSDLHLAQAYAPAKTPLPLSTAVDPYLWHPKKASALPVAPAVAPLIAAQQTPDTSVPVQKNRAVFNWQRTA